MNGTDIKVSEDREVATSSGAALPHDCADDCGDVDVSVLPSLFNCDPTSPGGKKKTKITEHNAWQHPGFNRGVNLISDRLMVLPAKVERRFGDGECYVAALDHELWPLVNETVCGRDDGDTLSAGWWRKAMTTWAITWGNAVSVIWRDRFGTPQELIPIDPRRVYLVIENRRNPVQLPNGRIMKTQKWYCIASGGRLIKLRPENVFHIKNMVTTNIDWSPGVVAYADKCLGVGVAATHFGGTFFDNGANGSGILMLPGHLEFEDEEQKKDFADKFQRAYAGLANANKTLLLEDGVKYLQTTIANNAAQFLESRRFSNAEAAHFLRLNVAILGGEGPYGYNTPEMARLDVRENAIEFWLTQYQDEYRAKILSRRDTERAMYRVGFDRDHGVALPFKEKVDGYTRLWNEDLIQRSQVKHIFGIPVDEADFVYKSETVSAGPQAVARQTGESAFSESVGRAMDRVASELTKATTSKKVFGFFDRRDDIEDRFRKTIRPTATVLTAIGAEGVEDLAVALCLVPAFEKAEEIIQLQPDQIKFEDVKAFVKNYQLKKPLENLVKDISYGEK